MKRPEVKIVIPDVLKLQLVDDWENVTKNNQVRSLTYTLEAMIVSLTSSSLLYLVNRMSGNYWKSTGNGSPRPRNHRIVNRE